MLAHVTPVTIINYNFSNVTMTYYGKFLSLLMWNISLSFYLIMTRVEPLDLF